MPDSPTAKSLGVTSAFKGRRDQVKIATKFGLVSHAGGGPGVAESG